METKYIMLQIIENYFMTNGITPSQDTIAERMGVKKGRVTSEALKQLSLDGYITFFPNKTYALTDFRRLIEADALKDEYKRGYDEGYVKGCENEATAKEGREYDTGYDEGYEAGRSAGVQEGLNQAKEAHRKREAERKREYRQRTPRKQKKSMKP